MEVLATRLGEFLATFPPFWGFPLFWERKEGSSSFEEPDFGFWGYPPQNSVAKERLSSLGFVAVSLFFYPFRALPSVFARPFFPGRHLKDFLLALCCQRKREVFGGGIRPRGSLFCDRSLS